MTTLAPVTPLDRDVQTVIAADTPLRIDRPVGVRVTTVRGGLGSFQNQDSGAGDRLDYSSEEIPGEGVPQIVFLQEANSTRVMLGAMAPQTFAGDTDVDPVTNEITITDHHYNMGDGPLRITGADIPDGINTFASGILTLSSNATGSVASTGILTFGPAPLNLETVTIEGKVYTFETSLTDSDGFVLIGGSASAALDNLIAAITNGAGEGTAYGTGTPVNADVTAVAGVGDTMDVTALVRGVAGDDIDTTTNVTGGSWGAANLTSGVDGDTVTLGTQVYTFNAATLVDTADNVLVGATASDSIDNLIAAINAGAGAGSVYGTGTTANADAGVAAGSGDTLDATALNEGASGNSIVTTETGSAMSWANATLTGGDDVDYFVIKVDDDTFKIATTRANAVAGTAVDITVDGSGTITISGVHNIAFPPGASLQDGSSGVLLEAGSSLILPLDNSVTIVGDTDAVTTYYII